MPQAQQPSYTSHFTHSLDDRNRITIPSAWRFAHDVDDVLLAVPQNGKNGKYIAVLPPAEAAKLRAKIELVALSDDDGQEFIANFFSQTQQLWFDKAGRISINAELLLHAGIKGGEKGGEAVLVGGLTKFNIYTPACWTEVQASAVKDKGETMRRLGI
jgi:MraZ protein